jgi:hypothetical protein
MLIEASRRLLKLDKLSVSGRNVMLAGLDVPAFEVCQTPPPLVPT